MEEVELIIKIPKVLYVKGFEDIFSEEEKKELIMAIGNGIPLPKKYDKLIDIGQCDRELFYQQCGGADSLITVKSAFDMLMSLPIIIETESEE